MRGTGMMSEDGPSGAPLEFEQFVDLLHGKKFKHVKPGSDGGDMDSLEGAPGNQIVQS